MNGNNAVLKNVSFAQVYQKRIYSIFSWWSNADKLPADRLYVVDMSRPSDRVYVIAARRHTKHTHLSTTHEHSARRRSMSTRGPLVSASISDAKSEPVELVNQLEKCPLCHKHKHRHTNLLTIK